MKAFLEEYGFSILAAIVVILLIMMISPVGVSIKESLGSIVNKFDGAVSNGIDTNVVFNGGTGDSNYSNEDLPDMNNENYYYEIYDASPGSFPNGNRYAVFTYDNDSGELIEVSGINGNNETPTYNGKTLTDFIFDRDDGNKYYYKALYIDPLPTEDTIYQYNGSYFALSVECESSLNAANDDFLQTVSAETCNLTNTFYRVFKVWDEYYKLDYLETLDALLLIQDGASIVAHKEVRTISINLNGDAYRVQGSDNVKFATNCNAEDASSCPALRSSKLFIDRLVFERPGKAFNSDIYKYVIEIGDEVELSTDGQIYTVTGLSASSITISNGNTFDYSNLIIQDNMPRIQTNEIIPD